MTELNLGLSSPSMRDAPQPSGESKVGWKRPAFALLLSLLIPGLGHSYNRLPIKGLLLAVSLLLLIIVSGIAHPFRTFTGLLVFLAVLNAGRIYVAADALRTARNPKLREGPFRRPWFVYSFTGVLIIGCTIFGSTDQFLRKFFPVKAFRTSSNSMCPTFCVGERFVADPYAFQENGPSRGAIVMFPKDPTGVLFVKRVIGVAGDVVSGSGTTIFVNGRPSPHVGPSYICGKPDLGNPSGDEPASFGPVRVPAGSLFVVGDRLAESYDSRNPGFGFVQVNQVRAKPLYIYWSSRLSRFGCPIR